MYLEYSDFLCEAVPESLKNLLLVMSTQQVFVVPSAADGHTSFSDAEDSAALQLWALTWRRIERFLPDFMQKLFPTALQPSPLSPPSTHQHSPPISNNPPHSHSPPLGSSPSNCSAVTEAPNPSGIFPVTIHPPLPSLAQPTQLQEMGEATQLQMGEATPLAQPT